MRQLVLVLLIASVAPSFVFAHDGSNSAITHCGGDPGRAFRPKNCHDGVSWGCAAAAAQSLQVCPDFPGVSRTNTTWWIWSNGNPYSRAVYTVNFSGGWACEFNHFIWGVRTKNNGELTCEMEKGGNPINVGVGNKFQKEVDRGAIGGGRLEFVRYYNSDPSAPSGQLGPRWSHTYERMIMPRGDRDATIVDVQRPDGRVMSYVWNGSAYAPDPDIVEVLSRVADGGGNITGWTLRTKADELETFDGMGRLTRIDWTDDSSVTLTYAAAAGTGVPFPGLLTSVTDTSGRNLKFTYHATGRMQSVADSFGTVATFGYGTFPGSTDERLKSATYADGKYREYFYDEPGLVPSSSQSWRGLLTGIKDERGLRANTWGYETDTVSGLPRATLSTKGDASSYIERVEITYGTSSATVKSYQSSTVYSNRVVNFETHFGVVKRESATTACAGCGGQIQNQNYDPATGFVDRVTDFRGTTTNYDINARGLETQRIEAESTSVVGPNARRTIQTDWHATWRQPTERRVLDSAGTLVELTRFAYNARGQRTAQCRVDVANTAAGIAARAYQCGSAVDAPARVRQTRYVFCDAVNPANPDPIGPSEDLAKGCPRIGLLRRIDGPRPSSDARDWSTIEYRLGDDSSCATSGACTYRKGDRWKSVDALGHVEEIASYDKAGRVLRTKAATGVITDVVYHPRGWPTQRTIRWNSLGTPHALDATTQTDYDDAGRVTKLTQPGGSFMQYGYDIAGRVADIWDNLGNHIVYTLDSLGNRIKEETFEPGSPSPVRRKAHARTFDALGRALTDVNAQFADNPMDPAAMRMQYEPDELGNVTLTTDQRGNRTLSTFDARNRLWRQVGDEGTDSQDANSESQYVMDALDRTTSVKDPKYFETSNPALITNYTYDGLGDLTKLSSPDTGVTAYSGYDQAGNLLSKSDARGKVENRGYDALGRVTGVTYPTPDSTHDMTIAYDAADTSVCDANNAFGTARRTAVTDESGTWPYCYDRHGNLTRKVHTTPDLLDVLTTAYSYDSADRVSTITYPRTGTLVTYGRDVAGRITTVSVGSNVVVSSAQYEPFGPLRFLSRTSSGSISWGFDANYWPTSAASAAIAQFHDLDDAGNITSLRSTATGPLLESYEYDGLNRLLNVRAPNLSLVEGFTYDDTGNRLSRTTGTTESYVYAAGSHRLASVGGVPRTYDAAGNTTAIGFDGYTYDVRGRLETAAGGQGVRKYNADGQRTFADFKTFAYDESGRLLGEYADSWECPPTIGGGEEDGFAATGGAQVDGTGCGEQQLQLVKRSKEFVWLDDMPVAYVEKSAAPWDTTNALFLVHADHLGTPRALTRFAGGAVVWRWRFQGNAFGQQAANEDVDGDGIESAFGLRFPGQHVDAGGLNYNYFRDYDPSIGRYMQSDPIGLAGGKAPYSYAGSRPSLAIDPKGLWYFSPTCSQPQRQKITTAMLDMFTGYAAQCFGSFGSTCSPCDCKRGNEAITWLSEARISCNLGYDCGAMNSPQRQLWLSPSAASRDAEVPGGCGCLKSTLYHEGLHATDRRSTSSEEDDVRSQTKRCFSCATSFSESGGPLRD